jgi:hypothetical protein
MEQVSTQELLQIIGELYVTNVLLNLKLKTKEKAAQEAAINKNSKENKLNGCKSKLNKQTS